MHVTTCVLGPRPEQSLPCSEGRGLVQFLILICCPLSHVCEQGMVMFHAGIPPLRPGCENDKIRILNVSM